MSERKRDIDVLAIGGIDADLVLRVPRIPGHDEKVRADFEGWQSGGPVGNMACAASRLGLSVHAVCQVGDDEGGRQVLDDYRTAGVDTSLCDVRPGDATPFTVILIDPTGEKVILLISAFEPDYDLERIGSALERTRVMFMLPRAKDFPVLAQLARDRGAMVMTDIEPGSGDDAEFLEPVLKLVDIASFNQFGVRAWTGREPSPALARELTAMGPSTVLFTRGAAGAIGANADTSLQVKGHKVEVVDTTGAGDTFHAAFVKGTLSGLALEAVLAYANAAGALSVTALGPRGLLPDHATVEAFLSERGT